MTARYTIIDFASITAIPCPCGMARRGLVDAVTFPGTLHRTDIAATAKPHRHRSLTELYYIISCDPGAVMEIDDDVVPLTQEMAILIPPLTVHRLVGHAQVLIVCLPKFDPTDEEIVET